MSNAHWAFSYSRLGPQSISRSFSSLFAQHCTSSLHCNWHMYTVSYDCWKFVQQYKERMKLVVFVQKKWLIFVFFWANKKVLKRWNSCWINTHKIVTAQIKIIAICSYYVAFYLATTLVYWSLVGLLHEADSALTLQTFCREGMENHSIGYHPLRWGLYPPKGKVQKKGEKKC